MRPVREKSPRQLSSHKLRKLAKGMLSTRKNGQQLQSQASLRIQLRTKRISFTKQRYRQEPLVGADDRHTCQQWRARKASTQEMKKRTWWYAAMNKPNQRLLRHLACDRTGTTGVETRSSSGRSTTTGDDYLALHLRQGGLSGGLRGGPRSPRSGD